MQGAIVRAAHGTPLPDGWVAVTEVRWRADRMPLAWDEMRAVADWDEANGSSSRVVVLHPTSGEVWVGVGGHAHSLGVFSDRAVMAAQVLDQVDVPSVRRWSDTPIVDVFRAVSPGWATLSGRTAVRVPLDELGAYLARRTNNI